MLFGVQLLSCLLNLLVAHLLSAESHHLKVVDCSVSVMSLLQMKLVELRLSRFRITDLQMKSGYSCDYIPPFRSNNNQIYLSIILELLTMIIIIIMSLIIVANVQRNFQTNSILMVVFLE